MKFREFGGFADEKNRITVMYCIGIRNGTDSVCIQHK